MLHPASQHHELSTTIILAARWGIFHQAGCGGAAIATAIGGLLEGEGLMKASAHRLLGLCWWAWWRLHHQDRIEMD